MSVNINTPFVVIAARAAVEGKSIKGQRPEAAMAFINADSADEREQAVTEFGAGFVRRGLREFAVAISDDEVANALWLLRDAIDIDGEVAEEFLLVTDAEEATDLVSVDA